MFLKHLLFFLLLFSCILKSTAQESYYHYVVFLKDKAGSAYSIIHPEQFLSQKAIDRRKAFNIPVITEDLPINSDYLNAIGNIKNCEIWNKSKWLNAVEIRFRDSQIIESVMNLPCVTSKIFLGKIKIQPPLNKKDTTLEHALQQPYISNHRHAITTISDKDYGDAFRQNGLINIDRLHNQQYMGKGITIAVFDAGFFNAYQTPGLNIDLRHLVVKDFVAHDNSVWEDDRHGANVLGFMKTFNPGSYIGTAPMADYILIRTEDAKSEYPVEEFNWLAGAEFADSIGVDLISSSLGYNVFDDEALSHTYQDLDGQTSLIAKAANIAKTKGIFIVVSAGNEGDNDWHKIGTPSDAKGVITIGATDAEGLHAEFSSYGPTADQRVKPDFVALGKRAIVASSAGNYSGNGTSYSTPIFAGALACLLQACPGKNFEEIKEALRLSATHANYPDSAYGYGIPDMALAAALMGNNSGLDTSTDIFWNNDNENIWSSMIIHFRSSSDQTVIIKITGKRKVKNRKIVQNKIKVKKGEWIHYDTMYSIIADQSKARKRKKYKEINLEFISESATQSRHFSFTK